MGGPLGFGERLLWIGIVGPDRRMIKTLTQMPIGRAPPDRAVLSELLAGMMMIARESAPGSTLAMLLTRPGGSDGISAEDRRWSEVIAHIAREQNVSLEALFFRANDRSLLPL